MVNDEADYPIRKKILIQKSLFKKSWNEIKINDSWMVFKVMSEMVDGFETLARIGPCVSIFGSARIKDKHKHYRLAEEIAYLLTKKRIWDNYRRRTRNNGGSQ